jgi:hypothetical protein
MAQLSVSFHAGVPLDVEQLPDGAFLGVVRTGGIAGRGPDAAILFLNHLGRGQLLGVAIAPNRSRMEVEPLRHRFGQTVRQRLGQDRAVVVVLGP